MGRTITQYLLTSESNFNNTNALKITDTSGNILTLASNEFPIKLTISGHVERIASANANATLYVCKSDRTSTYSLGTFWLKCASDDGTTLKHTDTHWNTFTGSGLKGSSLYLGSSNVNGRHTNRWEIIIYTHHTISVVPSVTAPTTAGNIITLTWTVPNMNDGALDYYQIQGCDRDNASAELGTWFDLTTSTTTSAQVSINSRNNGQRKYRVRAVGTNTVYNSDYRESGICTSQYASITAGQLITKAQMDTLRTQRIAQMTQ